MRLLLLFLCCWSLCPLAAQNDSLPADVIPLERATLRVGQWMRGQGTWNNSGMYWRVGTGVRWVPQDAFLAAVAPLQLEAGYKFHFLEAGLQYAPYALPLGRDNYQVIPLADSYTDTWPQMASFRSLGWSVGLHFQVAHVPLFTRVGYHRLHIAPQLRSRTTRADGTYSVFYPNNPYQGFDPELRYQLRCVAVGVEQDHWWAGVQLDQRLATNVDNFNYLNVFLGFQLSPGRGRAFDQLRSDYYVQPKRWAMGLERSFFSVPWARSSTGLGWSFEFSHRFRESWSVRGAFKVAPRQAGADYLKPEFSEPPFNQQIYRTGYWTDIGDDPTFRAVLADLVYFPAAEGSLTPFVTVGTGIYQTQKPARYIFKLNNSTFNTSSVYLDPPPKVRTTPGLSAGAGFDFRWFRSSLTLHKPFSGFPVFVEWNVGLHWAFGELI